MFLKKSYAWMSIISKPFCNKRSLSSEKLRKLLKAKPGSIAYTFLGFRLAFLADQLNRGRKNNKYASAGHNI